MMFLTNNTKIVLTESADVDIYVLPVNDAAVRHLGVTPDDEQWDTAANTVAGELTGRLKMEDCVIGNQGGGYFGVRATEKLHLPAGVELELTFLTGVNHGAVTNTLGGESTRKQAAHFKVAGLGRIKKLALLLDDCNKLKYEIR